MVTGVPLAHGASCCNAKDSSASASLGASSCVMMTTLTFT